MAIVGKAHVVIDGIKFLIDKSVQDSYVHMYRPITAERADISGMPGKQQLKSDILMWAYTDWVGGEGNRSYITDQTSIYSVGNVINPRIRGQLQGRPTRTRTTVAVTDGLDRPRWDTAAGVLWLAGSRDLFFTDNGGGSWSGSWNTAAGFGGAGTLFNDANYRVTSTGGDAESIYIAAYHSGASGSRGIQEVTVTGMGSGISAPVGSKLLDEQTSVSPIAGMCTMGGKLYAWTGRKLIELDIAETDRPLLASQHRELYDTGNDPVNRNVFTTKWWADCIPTENSVIFFYSVAGRSRVYEAKASSSDPTSVVGRPLWNSPLGFCIKSAAYVDGVVYFTGHWGGDSDIDGWGSAYALPLDSLRPVNLGFFRRHTQNNLQMQESNESYGKQVLMAAANTGRIFIFDAEFDGITMLDDLESPIGGDADGLVFENSNHRIGGVVTFGRYRFASIYKPTAPTGTTYQIVRYASDEEDDRATGMNTTNYPDSLFYLEHPHWDYDFPMEVKKLRGVYVTFKPLISGQQIQIKYSIDSATFVDAGTITSATTGNATGRVFLEVSTPSSQVEFYNVSFRVYVTSNTAVVTPIVYSVALESSLKRKRKQWRLTIRVKDELDRTRVTTGKLKGSTIRDRLLTIVDTAEVVTFLDGYRYGIDNTYTTHSVTIDEATDVIVEPGEGSMELLITESPA